MSARACTCGESFRLLPPVAPVAGAFTICAECGRTYRYELCMCAVAWPEVVQALEREPRWVLGGFEQVRRAAPNPNRLPRAGRFEKSDRAGTALGLAFALVVFIAVARLVLS